nr:sugar ABC transporter permease [uncultured Eisenbergiella sp.]
MKDNKFSKRKKSNIFWGYIMIAPVTLGLGIFYFYPFFKVFFDSFHEVGAFNKTKWIGLTNYQKMMTDTVMWQSLGNTVRYVLVIVPATLILSLLLAVMLNARIKGRSVFRVIYFIPAITMGAAVAMIWKWIFNGDYGILNYILGIFGISPIQWLSNPSLTWLAISIVAVWMNVGYNMIILLAGIQGISRSYYESASLDGANGVQQFFNITLPLVTPTMFFVLITTLISTFQTFDVIYMMISSKSLANEAAQSVVVYFYRNAFEFSKKGYASAIAILLFVIIMLVTLFQMKMQKKWVNYD